MAKRIKTAALNMYIDPALKRAAEMTAADDQRSLTSLVEKLLVEAARKAGHWPLSQAGEVMKNKKSGGRKRE